MTGPAVAGLPWDHEELAVASDPAHRRRYRALQSWYRETHLSVPAGLHPKDDSRRVGSMLDAAAVEENQALNFLDATIAAYVDERAPEIELSGGTIDAVRLRHNMLSSMPLCFNLFGALRAHPGASARVLADVLDLPIDDILDVVVEYAPRPAGQYLGDRTAFDALVVYRTSGGGRAFVGVETKYTEPFSPKVYTAAANPRYLHWMQPAYGFREGAVGVLEGRQVNQLWRNTMLALALREVDGYDAGHVAVLACQDDPVVPRAVEVLRGQMLEPLVRVASYEQLADRAAAEPALAAWADAFRTRYLDLCPVEAHARGRRT